MALAGPVRVSVRAGGVRRLPAAGESPLEELPRPGGVHGRDHAAGRGHTAPPHTFYRKSGRVF